MIGIMYLTNTRRPEPLSFFAGNASSWIRLRLFHRPGIGLGPFGCRMHRPYGITPKSACRWERIIGFQGIPLHASPSTDTSRLSHVQHGEHTGLELSYDINDSAIRCLTHRRQACRQARQPEYASWTGESFPCLFMFQLICMSTYQLVGALRDVLRSCG